MKKTYYIVAPIYDYDTLSEIATYVWFNSNESEVSFYNNYTDAREAVEEMVDARDSNACRYSICPITIDIEDFEIFKLVLTREVRKTSYHPIA